MVREIYSGRKLFKCGVFLVRIFTHSATFYAVLHYKEKLYQKLITAFLKDSS